MQILIVEDDRDIAVNLIDFFEQGGHAADLASDGITGLHFAVTRDYDVVILDLSLPGMGGLELCHKLRTEARRDTPVLMLTARDTLEDKLMGFEQGADDYLVKPFALKELEARIHALHKRRDGRVASTRLQAGDISLDMESLQVERAGQSIRLPPKCLRLLEVLLRQPGRVFSPYLLEQEVWGETRDNSDSLRTHMHTLRKGLQVQGLPDVIENVRGLGYRLVIKRDKT